MSADYIGGIAILDRRDPANQRLYCLGYREGRKFPHFIAIPVYQRGQPKPGSIAWEYDVAGDTLNVTPSVRMMASNDGPDIFHNAGAWSVKFAEGRGDGYEELYAANPNARDTE